MTSDKRDSSPDETSGRRWRSPTIELTATEIEPEAKDAAEASEPAAVAASADSRPEAAAGGEAQAQPTDGPKEPPPHADKSVRWLPFHFLKSPLAAGLAGGGTVLAMVAALWFAGLMQLNNYDTNALTARLGVLELQVRDLNDRIAARTLDPKSIENLLARLASLETTTAASKMPAADPESAKRIAAVEQAVKSLADTTTSLDRRLNDSVLAGRDARNRADVAAAAVVELEKNITRMRAAQVERSDIDRLAGRLSNLESAVKATRDALAQRTPGGGTDDRALRLAIAAGALRAAIEGGRPFAAELAAVKSLTGDAGVLAPLVPFAAKGLPDNATLVRELSELLPSMRRAVVQAADDGGFLQRLQTNAEKLVRIRPINDATGDDPAAIIARIEARAGRADIAGVLAELAKLPAAVRMPAQAWATKAEARLAAEALSRRFTAEAIAALGKTSP